MINESLSSKVTEGELPSTSYVTTPIWQQLYESNASLYTLVTLDLTSYLPQPLKEDDSCKPRSTETKQYRTQQYIEKKRFGPTLPMPYEQVKSKYSPYTWEVNIGTCPTGTMKGHTSH